VTRAVSREVVIDAPAQRVFDLLADPAAHARFDGSGTVQAAISGPGRLGPGARFGVRMRLGVPYLINNQVVEFEEGRRIAWRHFGRHVWRYELEPLPGERVRVVETFDYAPSPVGPLLELLGFPARNAKGIEATLSRLAALAEGRAQPGDGHGLGHG
jgi:uncharacterized protein YndB with AHSA1/START domain